MQVKRALHDIKYAPDVSMGAVVKEKAENEVMTIADFAQKGSELRQQFEQAGQEYRAVGTEGRKDLGDSLKKAVDASTEDILDVYKRQALMHSAALRCREKMKRRHES